MRLKAFIAIALFVFAFSARISAQTIGAGPSVAGEILVKFRPGTPANARADAHRAAGGTLRSEIARTGVQLVSVPGDQSAAIARYQRNPNILYAEPNFIRSIPVPNSHAPGTEVVPGDFYFHEQWALHNTGQEFFCIPWIFGDLCLYVATPDADIDAPEGWAISTGNPAVKVAVIDSGVDFTHPDLAANYAGGFNFIDPGTSPMDDHGHGTHVAGTIAAALDNLTGNPAAAEGVVGVAPNARILAYKVCSADGTCSDFAIEQALAQAVTDGAKVINMSLGAAEYSQSMNDGVQDAWNAGLVIVAAAGNDGNTNLFYPAALDHVISVAAFDEDDRRATFSNYGSWVDMSAPGNVIFSAYPLSACAAQDVPGDTGCYTWLSGTSMASPHVAGAAALVWSRSDVTSNSQVVNILQNSADPRGVDAVRLDSWTIHGGLNIHDALAYGSTTNLPPVSDAGVDQTVTDTDGDGAEIVTLNGSASSDADGSIVGYSWSEGSTILAVGATPAVSLAVGSHTLTLEVTDNLGDSDTDDVMVVVRAMNHVPVANAGIDQTVTDTDDNGVELVTLNGSGSSDSDGTIVSYTWREGSTSVGTGATPTVSLAVGSHTLTLEVTDDRGGSATDTVAILVRPMNHLPVANAGSDQTVTDTDGNGLELVTLNGSASSDSDGTIVSYTWREGSTTVATGATPAVSLAVGSHTITLEVTDDRGGSATDSVAILVRAMNHPPVSGNTSASAVIGTPAVITLTATDLETCELVFSVVQAPTSGTLSALDNQPCVAGSPNIDTARVTYTPGSTPGTYTFTYKANDGSADSNVATVTITVTAPVPPPPVPVTVTGITPNVVSQNAGVTTFVITGTGFANGAAVTFVNGSGPTPRVISVTRDSSTQLTLSVEIKTGGPRKNRLWDVRVTNPDGSTNVGLQLLTITP